ncbi:uncharacterized protein EKO05_0009380 [Ascochyta rabiei]|nr:uncharacterized protein EKO05_0009380 [Ascochyta rabiei]UPX19107.1 hypothetical protein EKO05_0009380 [Ascochyta rabiei]
MEETPQDALDISPSEAEQKTAKRRMAVQEIFDEHDMKKEDFDLMLERWKNSLFCCLTSAVAYLHEKNIRHKDIKPSNVLLSPHGMWLTDFGTAKDFTKSLTSTSESRERGTLRYCAPEVAQYEPSGRSADIFSLGCVFLEFLVATSPWSSLADLEVLCPLKNRSYEANLDRLDDWLRLLEDGYSESREDSTPHIALELRQMLNADRFMRPTARRLVWQWADPHVTRADAPNRCSKCQQWAGQFFSEPRLWEEMTEYITSGTRFLAASIEEQLSNGNPHDFNNPHDPDDPEDIFEDLQRRLDQLRR